MIKIGDVIQINRHGQWANYAVIKSTADIKATVRYVNDTGNYRVIRPTQGVILP